MGESKSWSALKQSCLFVTEDVWESWRKSYNILDHLIEMKVKLNDQ